MLAAGITLYFIRHGQTDWNREQRYQGQTDTPMNDTGREQAARNGRMLATQLGEAVAHHDFVASPLWRTVETMQIVRRELALPPDDFRRDDRLKEHHFGHWEGQLWRELPVLDPEGFAARQADTWGWTPRGGENYPMVEARVSAWLAELKRDTIVVSHGNISRSLRGIVLGLAPVAVPKLDVPQDRVLKIVGSTAEWF